MSRKILVGVMSLWFLYAGLVNAQDICQYYQERYAICMENQAAGRNLNPVECLTYTDWMSCDAAGCKWRADRIIKCVTDICVADTNFDGIVATPDYAALKREFGRFDCLSTPSIPGYLRAQVPKTGQTEFYATGDDGDLERGVNWPNPRFKINYCLGG